MLIGELAARTGASRRMIRYYEQQGLLESARHANGYREYDDQAPVVVGHIRKLLAAGLPTATIAGLLQCVHGDPEQPVLSGCPGMVDGLLAERARVAAEISRLSTSQKVLDTLLEAAVHGPR
ncbi:MerR family transcriptional regulator [Kribbella sp. CA-253562]|uniref:MerR family transcriptional regulator n=1 Tax=Kribbella sp. CA-253562 TaxID=3239942 RepID=UPI003D8C50A1